MYLFINMVDVYAGFIEVFFSVFKTHDDSGGCVCIYVFMYILCLYPCMHVCMYVCMYDSDCFMSPEHPSWQVLCICSVMTECSYVFVYVCVYIVCSCLFAVHYHMVVLGQ